MLRGPSHQTPHAPIAHLRAARRSAPVGDPTPSFRPTYIIPCLHCVYQQAVPLSVQASNVKSQCAAAPPDPPIAKQSTATVHLEHEPAKTLAKCPKIANQWSAVPMSATTSTMINAALLAHALVPSCTIYWRISSRMLWLFEFTLSFLAARHTGGFLHGCFGSLS